MVKTLPPRRRLRASQLKFGNSDRKTATLNTGDKIPVFGLGTWQSGPNEVKVAVEMALRAGYRHIDT